MRVMKRGIPQNAVNKHRRNISFLLFELQSHAIQ